MTPPSDYDQELIRADTPATYYVVFRVRLDGDEEKSLQTVRVESTWLFAEADARKTFGKRASAAEFLGLFR